MNTAPEPATDGQAGQPSATSKRADEAELVARTVAGDETRQLTGEAWLGKLDSIFVTQFFTCGAGRCFGDALYAPGPADSAAQHGELARLIARLRWRE